MTMLKADGYDCLALVLARAFDQAARGKGAQRHAVSKPFDHQPMQKLCELYGVGFALGQAGKKMQEAQRMQPDAAVRELLGAIVYIAGAVIHLEREAAAPANDNHKAICASSFVTGAVCVGASKEEAQELLQQLNAELEWSKRNESNQ